MADRFFCTDYRVEGRLTLEGDEARHLSRVRRLGPGDRVEVFDGRGNATIAEVVGLGKDRVELLAQGEPLADRVAPCRLSLATAVPKGERLDWLVEKATELGVSRLIPILTERSVVDPREAKLERLRRVVVEASKQCGRNRLLEIDRPTPWPAFLGRNDDSVRLVAHPGGQPSRAWPALGRGVSVTLAVGPEGGFLDAEIKLALARGWSVVGLGKTLLRIETAGLAGCSAILALCGGRDE